MSKQKKEEKSSIYHPTYQDAIDLNNVLIEMKTDPVANNFYKLKLSCIDALIQLKPIVAQVDELAKPSDTYLEYAKERNTLFISYAEKEGDSPVLYKDSRCTSRLEQGEHAHVVFYNFLGKDDEVDKKHKVLIEKYQGAIDVEADRDKTKEKLLSSNIPDNLKLKHIGEDYPNNLPMKYLYSFMIFGIVSEKA